MIIILISGKLAGMQDMTAGSWSEFALATVTSGDRRAGAARRAVIELLGGERCCLAAQEIADRLRNAGQPVGVASVYRTLDLLSAEGLVQRVDVGGRALYEAVVPGGEHHHHAVCERCGALTPFEDPALERAIDGLANRLGHRVQAHDVLIRGECAGCARS